MGAPGFLHHRGQGRVPSSQQRVRGLMSQPSVVARRAGVGCAAAPYAPTPWPVRAARWRDAPLPRALLHGRGESVVPGLAHRALAPQALPGVLRGWAGSRRRSGRVRAAGAPSGVGPTGWRWRWLARRPQAVCLPMVLVWAVAGVACGGGPGVSVSSSPCLGAVLLASARVSW